MNRPEQLLKVSRDLLNKMASLNKFHMKDSLQDYKSCDIHCIEYIGSNADVNVTQIAEAFYVTRGAISKLTKKLIKKGIIKSYQKPDNRKEIYFCLTDQGKKVYRIHEKLHRQFYERDKAVFDQIPVEQFESMIRFAEKYSSHLDEEIAKLGFDITNGNDFE